MGNVADEKLIHATHVMAEYLDNDEDGKVDNELVHKKMIENNATMVLFKDGIAAESYFDKAGEDIDELIEKGYSLQDLYDEEIHLDGVANSKLDATYEEVLHLITHIGYANAYPNVFGEKAGSEIALAMDTARGGHFETVPNKYPENAWYSYYDKTADYSTMITEYMYWSLTSLLAPRV